MRYKYLQFPIFAVIALLLTFAAGTVAQQRKPARTAAAKANVPPVERQVVVHMKSHEPIKGVFVGATSQAIQISIANNVLNLSWTDVTQVVFTDNEKDGPDSSKSAPSKTTVNRDEPVEDQFGVFLNKRPLKDKALESLQKIETESLKIDTPFKVIISATLGPGKDGKTIVLKNPKPVPSDPPYKNDPVMEKFVQDWIIAVGDAGWFGYLDKLKIKKVVITVEQTDTTFIASVKADQPFENDARQAASGLGTVLSIAALAAKGDEQLFLQKASVTSEGNTFVLNFNIEKPLVQEMLMRKLAGLDVH